MIDDRYPIHHPEELLSPSLLIFAEGVRRNLDSMIEIAGSPDRLRPHVKTHKMPALIRLVESRGIRKHKVATIAEAEMVAASGGTDVLVGYPIIGPNLARFARLIEAYPSTTFRATVDHPESARALSAALSHVERPTPVLVDLEIGMGRTGIAPGDPAASLYALVADLLNLEPDGLQAYDGHIRDKDPVDRRRSALPGIEAVHAFRERLLASGLPVPGSSWAGRPRSPSTPGTPRRASSARREPACSTTRVMPRNSPTCPSRPRPCSSPGSSASPDRAGSASTSATRRSPPTRWGLG